MKIQTKFLIVVIFLSCLCAAPAAILYSRSLTLSKTFNQIPQAVNNVAETAELNSLSQFIRYYDEVLTQSARNYAFTGNVDWKNSYQQVAPQLDGKIKEALSRGTTEDKQIFAEIDAANQALVAMEVKALDLVGQNQFIAAQKILDSQAYSEQKTIYQKGLEKYVASRGHEYNDTLAVSTQVINNSAELVAKNTKVNGLITLTISVFCILAGLTVYLFIRFLIFRPLEIVNQALREVSRGNLTYQIKTGRRDEIGYLANSFDQMAKNLNDARQGIEQKIQARTEHLTKLNNLMVGRELKMVELKQKIKNLESKR